MNLKFNVPTDSFSITIYDPEEITKYSSEDLAEFEFELIDGVIKGDFFGINLGGNGVYSVLVTDKIRSPEKDYACKKISNLGLTSTSGTICLCGYGFQCNASHFPHFRLGPGCYSATVYEILWSASPNWWPEDGESFSSNVPADFVIELKPSSERVIPNLSILELRLDTLYIPKVLKPPVFLFESSNRRVGTEIGMIYVSTVNKSPKAPNGLRLKACGIEGYRADLPNYEGLKWRDRVKFRVLSIDHKNRLYRGELIEKL